MMLGGVGAIVVDAEGRAAGRRHPGRRGGLDLYRPVDAPEMEQRITTYAEFSLSNNVNNIRRMESTTLQGTAIQRIYFDPRGQHRPRDRAGRLVDELDPRARCRPACSRRSIVRFSASSVPVIQLALTSAKQSLNQGLRLRPVPDPPDAWRRCRARPCRRRSAARRGRSWSISTSTPCRRSA